MQQDRRQVLKLLAQSAALGYLTINGRVALAKEKGLRWQQGKPLPIAIQEVYPAVFEQQIFVAGGFIPSDKPAFFGLGPTDKVFAYSLQEQSWKPSVSLPTARHHLGMASNNRYLYAIGGFSSNKNTSWKVENSVYRKSSSEGAWQQGPPLPIPMAESVYGVIGENIHLVGGKTFQAGRKGNFDTNKHFVLIQDQHWEQAAPATLERNSAASAVLDGKMYVVGGRKKGKHATNLRHLEVYDTKLDKWHSLQPLPQAVAGHAAVALNGKIYVTGGEAFGKGGNWKTGEAFSDVWAYDPVTDQWSREVSMPGPRHGHGTVAIDGQLYVIGGASKVGPQQTQASVLIAALK